MPATAETVAATFTEATATAKVHSTPAGAVAASETVAAANATAKEPPVPTGFVRRWLPDIIKTALAILFIIFAVAIWYKPPLIIADHPYLSYTFNGKTARDATLYRPLAMPARYYVRLPEKLAGRYQWFAVDRRREVAALTEAPTGSFFGRPAIKRSTPLGLDLEFRKIDGHEWQVSFPPDAIIFSNTLLTVRLDTKEQRQ